MGKTVCCSMYGDPFHCGHLEYLELSKEYEGPDGKLVVILNTDAQAIQKKGFFFMHDEERVKLVGALRVVDKAVLSIDTDRTVCGTIRMLAGTEWRPDAFLKGGDSKLGHNVPEMAVCAELGIEVKDGFGDKVQSSSWLIDAAIQRAAAVKTPQ